MIIRAYPLRWPLDRPRTPARDRRPAKFREGNSGAGTLSYDVALGRLLHQVQLLGALYPSLSSDVRYNRDGSRDRTGRGSTDPADPGAALAFRLDGRDYELACDRWDTLAGNIAAIAAHIDALRGQERWGVADLAQAFAGHVALPAPDPWWVTLGVAQTAPLPVAEAAYRALSKSRHPDAGGTRADWDRLQAAIAAAREALA